MVFRITYVETLQFLEPVAAEPRGGTKIGARRAGVAASYSAVGAAKHTASAVFNNCT